MLSIVNGKVQMKSDNGLWYEVGLFEDPEDGRVYDGAITQVAVPPVGYDEKAVILADNGQPYDVELFTLDTGTPEERTYLRPGQIASSDPLTDPIDLALDGEMYRMVLNEDDEDSRIYHNWALWSVIANPVIVGGLSTFIRPNMTRARYRVGV